METTNITKKALLGMYPGYRVISICYCGAQYLLRGAKPKFHNSGVYGINWKAYVFPADKVIVVTGARSLMTGHPDYDLLNTYEQRAMDIANEYWLKDSERVLREAERLRHEFFMACAN